MEGEGEGERARVRRRRRRKKGVKHVCLNILIRELHRSFADTKTCSPSDMSPMIFIERVMPILYNVILFYIYRHTHTHIHEWS